jgi:hypothetical protein
MDRLSSRVDLSPPWDREVPDGIYANLDASAYHDGPGISKSGLDLIAQSPAHYKLDLDERRKRWEGGQQQQPSPAFRLGSLAHSAILEPHTVNDLYRVIPADINRKTKAGREEWAQWQKENADFTHVTQDEIAAAAAMKEAVYASEDARMMLRSGDDVRTESSVYWHEGDIQCRCRPDVWHIDEGVLVDLKTTNDASPRGFARSVSKFRYHVQAAFYLLGTGVGLEAWREEPATAFYIVAVEKAPPYGVAVYHMSPEYVALGTREALSNLETYASCIQADYWPSYNSTIHTIEPPKWLQEEN